MSGKLKMTKKNILYFGKEVFETYGASNIDKMLHKFFTPMGYSAGIYGWNYDVYDLGFCFVLTGYRNTFEYVRDPVMHEKMKRFLNELAAKCETFNAWDCGKVKNEILKFEKSFICDE